MMGQVSKLILAGYLYTKPVFPFTIFFSQNESCLKFNLTRGRNRTTTTDSAVIYNCAVAYFAVFDDFDSLPKLRHFN